MHTFPIGFLSEGKAHTPPKCAYLHSRPMSTNFPNASTIFIVRTRYVQSLIIRVRYIIPSVRVVRDGRACEISRSVFACLEKSRGKTLQVFRRWIEEFPCPLTLFGSIGWHNEAVKSTRPLPAICIPLRLLCVGMNAVNWCLHYVNATSSRYNKIQFNNWNYILKYILI